MNQPAQNILSWIDRRQSAMVNLLIKWANINSGSRNLTGLAKMAAAIRPQLAPLGGKFGLVKLPPQITIGPDGNPLTQPLGRAIRLQKRPRAPIQVLLNIHMDTVYSQDHPFQRARKVANNRLQGPGVADAKGGLVVLLTALQAYERFAASPNLGWELIINPDEEIGSPGSASLLQDVAPNHHAGLLFEPAFPDGSLVNTRSGSGNFTLIVRGHAAHVGRDFSKGRSALNALAKLLIQIESLNASSPNSPSPDLIVNFGKIEGGGPVNVVPDLAIGHFNVRVTSLTQQRAVEELLQKMIVSFIKSPEGLPNGIAVQLHGGFHAPPKPLTPQSQQLCTSIEQAAASINLPISWTHSGGVSDGNRLAAAGLANIDTLGPVGGNLHSPREFVEIPSLIQRAKLAALLLLQLSQPR